ncbi:helix-turn-helix domain-containing protein [Amnibacterium setariae]|uniref:DNA-binding protein n=1 Tax=Amnibacterium setariae TaxID=2306585 RepID=A0A3A1TXN3_9MICO|nr:helix-turn-helix domain-containing protein [Amnibacterium setariae]RIX26469.1 DNA-binding protein [Amnibacterium setariae]
MNLDELRRSKAATITRADAAELLDCDPRTITAGIAAGTIPAIHIGRRVVIPREPLLALLTAQPALIPSQR